MQVGTDNKGRDRSRLGQVRQHQGGELRLLDRCLQEKVTGLAEIGSMCAYEGRGRVTGNPRVFDLSPGRTELPATELGKAGGRSGAQLRRSWLSCLRPPCGVGCSSLGEGLLGEVWART